MGKREAGLLPKAAAEVLGVSPQTLRRYAASYEQVFEAVPRQDGQRYFTESILGRLRAAQELVASGQAGAIKGALEFLKDGPPPKVVLPRRSPSAGSAGPAVERELAGLREELKRSREAATDELSTIRELLSGVGRGVDRVQGAAGGAREELQGIRQDLERLVAALVELSYRQVESSADMTVRLEGIEKRLASMEQDYSGEVSPGPWWRFGRRRR